MDIVTLKKYMSIYDSLGIALTNFKQDAESQDYQACTFEMNGKRIIFRTAKITPTKIGQFVTLWKRNNGIGPIMPYDFSDPFDMCIIDVSQGEHWGQFIFPKEALITKGVVSQEGKEGKRAIRVYPEWDSPDSKQAKQTQEWQRHYFFNEKAICSAGQQIKKLF